MRTRGKRGQPQARGRELEVQISSKRAKRSRQSWLFSVLSSRVSSASPPTRQHQQSTCSLSRLQRTPLCGSQSPSLHPVGFLSSDLDFFCSPPSLRYSCFFSTSCCAGRVWTSIAAYHLTHSPLHRRTISVVGPNTNNPRSEPSMNLSRSSTLSSLHSSQTTLEAHPSHLPPTDGGVGVALSQWPPSCECRGLQMATF